MKLTFDIKNQIITRTDISRVIANSADYLEAEFSFSSDWDNLTKVAHFKNGNVVLDVPLDNNEIKADKHLNLGVGTWKVSVEGVLSEQRIETNATNVTVRASGSVSHMGPVPDVYQQLLAIISELSAEAAPEALVNGAVEDFIDANYSSMISQAMETSKEEFTGIVNNIKNTLPPDYMELSADVFMKRGIFTTHDVIEPPYDDLDTVPINSVVTYAELENVSNAPEGFLNGNVIVFGNVEDRGITEFVADAKTVAYRTKWGSPGVWNEWRYLPTYDNTVVNDKYFSTNDTVIAPYDDLDTFPRNKAVVYASFDGVANTPDGFIGGTVISQSVHKTSGGALQFVVKDGSVAFRQYWGSPASWSKWHSLTNENGFQSIPAVVDGTDGLADFNDALSNRYYCINVTNIPNAPIKQKGQLITFGAMSGTSTPLSGRKVQLFFANGEINEDGETSVWWRTAFFMTGAPWSTWKRIDKPFLPSISMFESIGVVGDSFSSGEVYVPIGGGQYYHEDYYNLSWGQVIARKNGISCTNFSRGGLTSQTWLTDAKGKALLESESPKKLYVVALGINDSNRMTLGTTDDITNESGTTFYSCYSNVIRAIKARAPKAKIVCTTPARFGGNYDLFGDAIKNIANYFGIPAIDLSEVAFFKSDLFMKNQVSGHPTAMNYSAMASEYQELIEECVKKNNSYFADFVG